MGVAVAGVSIVLDDVVEAPAVAYNVRVGGLLMPVLGGLLWKRDTARTRSPRSVSAP